MNRTRTASYGYLSTMARLFVLIFGLLVSPFLNAQTLGFGFGGSKTAAVPTKATLVSEVSAIAPGKPFTVALQLTHPDGWHSYYRNSGGLEKSPAITWTLPEGFSAGPIQWPVPEVKDGVFGKSFVYSGKPVFLVEITPPATLKPGESITLQAAATWQICQQTCRDESAKFSLTLPVAEKASTDPEQLELILQARRMIPQPSKSLIQWEAGNGTIRLKISPPPIRDSTDLDLDFIPDQPFVHPLSESGSFTHNGDAWVLTLKQATKDALDNDIPLGETLSGILVALSLIHI